MSTRSNNTTTIAVVGITALFGAAATILLLCRYREKVMDFLSKTKKDQVSIDDRLDGIEDAISSLKHKITQ